MIQAIIQLFRELYDADAKFAVGDRVIMIDTVELQQWHDNGIYVNTGYVLMKHFNTDEWYYSVLWDDELGSIPTTDPSAKAELKKWCTEFLSASDSTPESYLELMPSHAFAKEAKKHTC